MGNERFRHDVKPRGGDRYRRVSYYSGETPGSTGTGSQGSHGPIAWIRMLWEAPGFLQNVLPIGMTGSEDFFSQRRNGAVELRIRAEMDINQFHFELGVLQSWRTFVL